MEMINALKQQQKKKQFLLQEECVATKDLGNELDATTRRAAVQRLLTHNMTHTHTHALDAVVMLNLQYK